jgi:hypothetical protein
VCEHADLGHSSPCFASHHGSDDAAPRPARQHPRRPGVRGFVQELTESTSRLRDDR